jgi:hypothetical protein
MIGVRHHNLFRWAQKVERCEKATYPKISSSIAIGRYANISRSGNTANNNPIVKMIDRISIDTTAWIWAAIADETIVSKRETKEYYIVLSLVDRIVISRNQINKHSRCLELSILRSKICHLISTGKVCSQVNCVLDDIKVSFKGCSLFDWI